MVSYFLNVWSSKSLNVKALKKSIRLASPKNLWKTTKVQKLLIHFLPLFFRTNGSRNGFSIFFSLSRRIGLAVEIGSNFHLRVSYWNPNWLDRRKRWDWFSLIWPWPAGWCRSMNCWMQNCIRETQLEPTTQIRPIGTIRKETEEIFRRSLIWIRECNRPGRSGENASGEALGGDLQWFFNC